MRCAIHLPTIVWQLLLFIHSVNAYVDGNGKWETTNGLATDTCTAACTRDCGATSSCSCDAAAEAKMNTIDSALKLRTLWVTNMGGYSTGESEAMTVHTGPFLYQGTLYYSTTPAADCDATPPTNLAQRFCYCSIPAAASVGGDPITYYGGLRIEFEVPINVPSLLLATSEMSVFGTTFEGWTKQDQWINRLVVTTEKSQPMADIKVKDNLVDFSRNRTAHDAFETLDVAMFGRKVPVFPPRNAYFPDGTVSTSFVRKWHHPEAPQRECAMIAGHSFKLIVCSTSAHEYYGEYGSGAWAYAHLDVEVLDMDRDKFTFSGILPEMWGIVPISDATQKMIKSRQRVSDALGGSSATIDITAPATAPPGEIASSGSDQVV